jgi:hypothetical protein
MDAEQLAAAQRRMQEDIAAIDLCAGLLEALRLRLRWAVLAASLGAVCGWIAGSFGQPGAALLAGSAGAIAAAVGGWCWRAQGWDQRRVRIHVVGIVPGACLVVAWLAGTHILWAIGGAGLAAGGSWIALRRLPLERGLEADPGTPA